ncbi:hypothetical protein IDJ77_13555 [Mucilaginibacter sp. ZT4R22]|uniref:DUF3592 domain-containing protein n=1 Tax=Mucilaginibacter pankratovii TaxID=2772110 RepID=A0ABR7WRA9_9SPHI|nr:hypothetical protein [Mucilaginibacter pankratovii]MBD1364842.1 hypothetical protein [Mucilaginibacter pankratovii]
MKQRVLAILFFGTLLYFLLKPFAEDFFLKSFGICANASITNESTRVRYQMADYKYQFSVAGRAFTGNSLVTDANKIGDTVCVVYLKVYPSVSRRVIYFNNFKGCTCKY